jgi:hypothetical protein
MNPQKQIQIHKQAIELLEHLEQAQREHSSSCMNFAQYERAEMQSLSSSRGVQG